MNKLLAAGCAATALVLSYIYLVPAADSPASHSAPTVSSSNAAAASASMAPGPQSLPGADSMSPFGRGKPAPPEDPKVRAVRLEATMKKLGFFTPEKYYRFDLATLKKMAATGDPFANLQLAEQYYSESEGLENHAGYDIGASPKVEANKYLEKAATMGIVRAGTLLSLRYQEQGKPVDAYAWKILSEKFGDKSTKISGYDNVRFATDPATLKRAQDKADEILENMLNGPRIALPQ